MAEKVLASANVAVDKLGREWPVASFGQCDQCRYENCVLFIEPGTDNMACRPCVEGYGKMKREELPCM